jgi:DNA-binding winged helix-turn-helix (wHTH) protein
MDEGNTYYKFGPYRINTSGGDLERGGETVWELQTETPLTGLRAFLGFALVRGKGTIKHDELMERIWPDSSVIPANLNVHIATLRSTLGKGAIVAVSRRGFRFTVPVSEVDEEGTPVKRDAHGIRVLAQAVPQLVRYRPGDAPGILVENASKEGGGQFVPWIALQLELERELLPYLGRLFGDRALTVSLVDFKNRRNWRIHIHDGGVNHTGSVWLGGDPYKNWNWDGLVRVGKAIDDDHHVVWQVFQRYSDGTYRRIVALDTPDNRPNTTD